MSLLDDFIRLLFEGKINEYKRAYFKRSNEIIRDHLNENSEYSVSYSIPDAQKEVIKEYILNGSYNNLLKSLALQLYNYTETENLIYCVNNIKNVKIVKDDKFKIKPFSLKKRHITGQYDPYSNTISYYSDNTLSHEFLHMSSTPKIVSNDYYTTGFKILGGNIEFGKGLNEGYTDLLNRRIFFDEDYNTDTCYKVNIYLLRIFELLYDDYRTMERDYFISNYQSPIGNFIKYGSYDEFFKLSTYLDWLAFTKVIDGEDKEAFALIKKVIKRCSYDKLDKAEEITEEYFKSKKQIHRKILK